MRIAQVAPLALLPTARRTDVSISNAQRRPLPHARWFGTVYNGIPLSHFTFREAKMKPMLRDPTVEYIGEIDETHKDEFLGNAFAYLFPINWPAPFGMMMIEAACGTPVIAMNLGSVPVVVVHGQTGFVCRSQAEMIDAVQRAGDLSRDACRMHVENHFSAVRMAEMYETVYRTVLAAKFDDADAGVGRSDFGALGEGARGLTRIQHTSPLAQSVGSGMDLGVVDAGRMVGST